MKGTIICYGDSNTYGYDPELGGEGRFPKEVRWTGILEKRLQCTMENYGLCGRCIPTTEGQLQFVCRQLEKWKSFPSPRWLWIMLGTNDLLQQRNPSAPKVAGKMKNFLEVIMNTEAFWAEEFKLLLIAPPKFRQGAWVNEEALVTESQKLGEEYEKVAKKLGISFVDAGKWEIPLTFDGVHFSEEGHKNFGRKIGDFFDFY
jgi:lysophospholipase L1-like esterase